MLDMTPPAPAWRCTGLLADLVTPLRAHLVEGCIIEGTQVRWQYPVGHDAISAAMEHPVIRSGRFDDRSVDWAEALLAEHLTDEDMFLLALAGSQTTFTLPPPLKVDSAFRLSDRSKDETITIRVDWTNPRRIHLVRPIPVNLYGSSGSGKGMAMQTFIYASQMRGQQVVIIDPKATGVDPLLDFP